VHPRQQQLDATVQASWFAALEDAGMSSAAALLYLFEGARSVRGWQGWHLPADRTVYPDPELPEIDDLIAELNSDECIEATKILIWRDRRPEEVAATIRHELEHASQYAAYGQRIVNLHELAADVMRVRVANLPRGSLFYTVIPIELDANGAAARFAYEYYGRDRWLELLHDEQVDGTLFRSHVGPGALETLPERMISFLAAHRDLVDRVARDRQETAIEIVDRAWRGAGERWATLTAADGLSLPR
jgi:hypothetical protein